MFDFLLSEAFWMEVVIAASISGAAGIIVALIALAPLQYKILNKLAANETASKVGHDGLSREHGGLYKEHDSLSKEHDRLSAEHKDIGASILVLREEQLQDKVRTEERQRALTEKQLDIQRTVEQIKALGDEVTRLQSENQRLVQTQTILEQKNAQLQQELNQARRPPTSRDFNQAPEQDDDWDMEP